MANRWVLAGLLLFALSSAYIIDKADAAASPKSSPKPSPKRSPGRSPKPTPARSPKASPARAASPRIAPLAGGLTTQDPASAAVQQAAAKAVELINKDAKVLKQLAASGPVKLTSVSKAQSQVVAGFLYHLTLVLSDTTSKQITVDVKVVQLPVMTGQTGQTWELNSVSLAPASVPTPSPSPVPMSGGLEEATTGDASVQQAAAKAVELLNKDSQKLKGLVAKGPVKLVSITQSRTQVVAGTKYYFKVVLQDAAGKQINANLELWVQVWLNHYELTSATLS